MLLPFIAYAALLILFLGLSVIHPAFAKSGIVASLVVAIGGGAGLVYYFARQGQAKLYGFVRLYFQRLEQAHLDFAARRQIDKQVSDLGAFIREELETEAVAVFSRKKQGFVPTEVHGVPRENLKQLRIGHRDELVRALETRRAMVSIRKALAGGTADRQFSRLPFTEALPILTSGKCSHFILTSTPGAYPLRLVRPFLLALADQIANSRHLDELLNKHNQQLAKLRKELDSLYRAREEKSSLPVFDAKAMINAQDRLMRIRSRDQLYASLLHLVQEQFKVDFAFILMKSREPGTYELKYRQNLSDECAAQLPLQDTEEIVKLVSSSSGCKRVSQLAESKHEDKAIQALKEAGVRALGILKEDTNNDNLIGVGRVGADFSNEEVEAASSYCRMFNLVLENQAHFEQIEQMSYTDSMTGLYNYRYFYKRLQEEMLRAKRFNRHMALVIFDIDEFKVFNDTYGHQSGDYLLEQLGALLSKSVRSIDVVSRYGGEEFCVIMPETTSDDCTYFMDRMRITVLNHEFKDRFTADRHRITVSLGGAIYPNDAQRIDRLIYCADMALLQAKSSGRNRSFMFDEKLLNSRSDLYDKNTID
jgi:diguanylate cyclase (GGDEF)-like protein